MNKWISGFLFAAVAMGASHLAWANNGGETERSKPTWEERVMHMLANEARTDPVATLKDCTVCAEKSCYKDPAPPLFWDHGLGLAAKFHSAHLRSSQCFNHNSPCTLVDSIGEDFPSRCDGSVECACVDAVSCNGGTPTFTRIGKFLAGSSTKGSGENIAWGRRDPKQVHYQWYWEPTDSKSCDFTSANGHRQNILNARNRAIGIGMQDSMSTQDFGTQTQQVGISAGIHYPDSNGLIEFKAHYYDPDMPIRTMQLAMNDQCVAMQAYLGNPQHAAFLIEEELEGECIPYAFIAEREDGVRLRYPEQGDLLFHCAERIYDAKGTMDCEELTGSSFTTSGDCTCSVRSMRKYSAASAILVLLSLLALGFQRMAFRRRLTGG